MNEEKLKKFEFVFNIDVFGRKLSVFMSVSVCNSHKDIKVRQALYSPFVAAYGSVPHYLLQVTSCYIVSSGASFFLGWTCR